MNEIHNLLFDLMLILLAARIFAEIAVRLNIPPVIGEITAGIVLGPSLFGFLEANQMIRLLGEIGIILLLFEVGLQTDGSRLLRTGMRSLITALGGFIFPFIFSYIACRYFLNLSLIESLFIGGALTATSIGITIRVLSGLGKQNQNVGQVVLGAAVIDDVLGVILLGVLLEMTLTGSINIENTSRIILFIAIFFALAPLAAKVMSFIIKRFDNSSILPGLIPTTVMSLVLFFAWLAYYVGAPELLGGFAAGLALSRRFFLPFGLALKTDEAFSNRISEQMKPVIQLFTPIFFVVVGLSVDLSQIDWNSSYFWIASTLLFVIAVAGKLLGAILVRGVSIHERIATGLAMTPRGEVGLIFIELGKTSNILNNEIYVIMLLVIVLTTILPPFVLKWYYKKNEDYMT